MKKLLYIAIEDKKILDPLVSFFTEQGYDVLKFDHPEKALFAVRKNPPQVIICDQDFKMMSGIRFLRKVAEFNPRCITILLMRESDFEVAADAVNEGIVRKIVSAPWTTEDILKAVEEGYSIFTYQQDNPRIPPVVIEEKKELEIWEELLKNSVKNRSQIILQKKADLQQLNQKLESNIYETIKVLFSFLEKKNKWIGGHSKKVAAFAVELASEMRIPPRAIWKIEIAALLHDIGKIGISDKIVSRSFHLLSKSQQDEIKEHPLIGQKIISPLFALSEIGTMIRHHHEHWDGTGYPDRLKGEDIPIGARIIAVVNVFTNLMEKVYHRAKDPTMPSLKEMVSKMGKELDSKIVDTFINIIEEKRISPKWKKQEVKIHFKELQEGMMLSRDVQTTRGTIVLRKGTVIIQNHIDYLSEFDRLEKLFSEVYIYVDASEDGSIENDWSDEAGF